METGRERWEDWGYTLKMEEPLLAGGLAVRETQRAFRNDSVALGLALGRLGQGL